MLCRFIIEMSRDNRQFIDLDVFYATVSPMDRHGYFSLGTTAAECQALAEQAKHIF